MTRREFITLLGGAAAWPITAVTQEPGKLRIIGYMGSTTPSAQSPWTSPFLRRLRELSWIEGRNLAIEYRWGEGRNDSFAEIAAEFVRLKVDVIVTYSAAPVLAAKQATSVIPIVFAAAPDHRKRLDRESGAPGRQRDRPINPVDRSCWQAPGIFTGGCPRSPPVGDHGTNIGNPGSVQEMGEVQAASRVLNIEFINLEIRRAEDIAPAFETLKGGRADALYVCAEPLVNANRTRINSLAQGARLRTIYGFREYVEAGALLSYGANVPDARRRIRRQNSARREAR